MWKKFLHLIRSAAELLVWLICICIPISKNKLVVVSYYGRGYGDNAKYIVDEILKKKSDIRIIWLVKNETEAKTLPQGIEACKYDSFKSIFHISTAKVWLDNCRKGFCIKKRGQKYMQTWHGGGAQKRCEMDVEEVLGKYYVRVAKMDAKHTDIMVSDSRFMTELYLRAFWYNGEVLEVGYPRYDIIIKKDKTDIKDKVFSYFDLSGEKKTILYAPTFRKDHDFAVYDVDYPALIDACKKRFGGDFIVLVHLHPNVADKFEQLKYDNIKIYNATYYPDMQELIAVSDVLIGDYSSVNYEFSLAKKPVFRFALDLENYRNDRNFYYPIEEYPYPLAQDNNELVDNILKFDNEKYLKDLVEFFGRIGSVINDTASEKCADWIVEQMN